MSYTESLPYYVLKGGNSAKWFCYPLDLKSQPAREPMNSRIGALHLLAEVAYLKVIDKRHPLRSKHGSNYIISPKDPLIVVDDDDFQIGVGVVFEDGNMLSRSTYSFVKLSQTILSSSWVKFDPAFDQVSNRILMRPGEPAIAINNSAKIADWDKILTWVAIHGISVGVCTT